MKLANKILIGGVVLAGAVEIGGFWNQHRLQGRLSALVAECKDAGARTAAIPPPQAGYIQDAPKEVAAEKKFDLATARPITADEVLGGDLTPTESGPWEKYKADAFVCDPGTLVALSPRVGMQAKIADAYYASRSATTDAHVLAMCIAILSVIPWLWYFLLRRIVELRNAIGGRLPPE